MQVFEVLDDTWIFVSKASYPLSALGTSLVFIVPQSPRLHTRIILGHGPVNSVWVFMRIYSRQRPSRLLPRIQTYTPSLSAHTLCVPLL